MQWLESIHTTPRRLPLLASPVVSPRKILPPRPFRDPCIIASDLEADPSFAIHTSIFLSGGAGEDFTGGSALFLDDHRSNTNPRRKIRRGLSVDGLRGRVIVSTGGDENRRCRMPTRAGIRIVLQLWWDFRE